MSQIFPVVIDSQFREAETAQNKTLLDRDENTEMDETTIKSIDTSRPSDFRFKAVTSERAYQEMISETTAEPPPVQEKPKTPVDMDSDESRPVSTEPKELCNIDDDLSDDVAQQEGNILAECFTTGPDITSF